MAERDKVIKSGQFTLPRLAFLALVGVVLWAIVFFGGVYLTIGYWLLTLAICGLLYLIAIDYGIKMDKVDLSRNPAQAPATASSALPSEVAPPISAAPRPKRKGGRSTKRRR
jgi:hypothetical protein